MKRLLTAVTALLAASLVPLAAGAQETVKLGIIFPLSGGSGPQGQNTVKAVESMTAMINEAGGVLGKQIGITAAFAAPKTKSARRMPSSSASTRPPRMPPGAKSSVPATIPVQAIAGRSNTVDAPNSIIR